MNKLQIPSHQEVKEYIKRLDELDWEEYQGKSNGDAERYMNRMHQRMTKISQIFSQFYLTTPIPFPFDINVFRVRKLKDIKDLTKISEYSHPPAFATTKNLRANLIGHPVFYGAEHPLVALLEYLQQWNDPATFKEDKFVISSWKIKKDRNYLIAPFIPKTVESVNEYSVLNQYTNEEFREKTGTNLKDDKINALREANEYFSNLFLKDHKRTISSYLGHKCLYGERLGNHPPPILIYPSLKAKYGNNNLAFHPNFVKDCMTLSHTYIVSVKSIDEKINGGMGFNYQLDNTFGVFNNGKVRPASISKNIELFKVIYKQEWGYEFNSVIV